MQLFILLGQALFGKLPFCALVGGVLGVVAGSFFGLVVAAVAPGGLTATQIVQAGLMLAVAGWITVLVMFGLWLRYGLAQLWVATAVNALLTSILTVWVGDLVHVAWLCPLIGLLIGVLVGLILCWLCPQFARGWSVTHG